MGRGPRERRRKNFDFPPVDKDRAFNILDVLQPMAEAKQRSVAQLALAWLMHQPVVSSVIIGANKLEQLEDNLKSVEVSFTEEELRNWMKSASFRWSIRDGCWILRGLTGWSNGRRRREECRRIRKCCGGSWELWKGWMGNGRPVLCKPGEFTAVEDPGQAYVFRLPILFYPC